MVGMGGSLQAAGILPIITPACQHLQRAAIDIKYQYEKKSRLFSTNRVGVWFRPWVIIFQSSERDTNNCLNFWLKFAWIHFQQFFPISNTSDAFLSTSSWFSAPTHTLQEIPQVASDTGVVTFLTLQKFQTKYCEPHIAFMDWFENQNPPWLKD